MKNMLSRYAYVLYVLVLIFITAFILVRQINIAYIDYGEGSYLYEAWRFSEGERLYGDMIVPQPPVLFLWGAFLMKIYNSILFIRAVNLVLLLLGNILFLLILRKVFKNTFFVLSASVLYFFLPITAVWWITFTAEPLLRVLFMLIIYVLIPTRNLSMRKIAVIALLSATAIYTKYTTLAFILFIFFFLFFSRKKYVIVYSISVVFTSLAILLLLQKLTGGNYLIHTLFIRKNLLMKTSYEVIYNMTLFMLSYISLIALNFVIGVVFLKRRLTEQSFLVLLPVGFSVNIVVTFLEGTYNYIFYPIEPFFLLGYLYAPALFLSVKKNRTLFIPAAIFFLLSSMSIIFFFQWNLKSFSSSLLYQFSSRTEKIADWIEKESRKGEAIIAPPYYAYLTMRKLSHQYSDPFLFSMVYLRNRRLYGIEARVKEIRTDLKRKKIPIVIMDWRLSLIKEFRQAVMENYSASDEQEFAVEKNIVFTRRSR